jgi:aspartate kinase
MEPDVYVLKFGGTSVATGDRIRYVAAIIARHVRESPGTFPVVVVSALAGITDQLLRIAHYASTGCWRDCEQELRALKQRHMAAAERAVHGSQNRRALSAELATRFAALDQDVDAMRSAAGENPVLTTAIIAWGERLAALLLAAATCDVGLPAAVVPEEVIVTGYSPGETSVLSETFVCADPLLEETRVRARELIYPFIECGIVPIVAGFIGRTVTGLVTTLGRNGSDFSATVIGAAMDCVGVSIYTDVDGIFTADPRIVTNARLLPQLSYAEATCLSWFGASVLHPRTLLPLADRRISLWVRNTFRPQSCGTVIGPAEHQSGAIAITVRRNLVLLTIEQRGTSAHAGQVFAWAARMGIAPVAICSSSGQQLWCVIDGQVAQVAMARLTDDVSGWRVCSRRDLAACACIGSGFVADPLGPARAGVALAQEHISVVAQGTIDPGMVLVVEDQDSERPVRCLHQALITAKISLARHGLPEQWKKVLEEAHR